MRLIGLAVARTLRSGGSSRPSSSTREAASFPIGGYCPEHILGCVLAATEGISRSTSTDGRPRLKEEVRAMPTHVGVALIGTIPSLSASSSASGSRRWSYSLPMSNARGFIPIRPKPDCRFVSYVPTCCLAEGRSAFQSRRERGIQGRRFNALRYEQRYEQRLEIERDD